ncbi:hypothetical protein B0H16DRAFT_1891898 [Mycena metata]|uniref:Uncharacterized protein n=1 Tax=Mycena metata TaxID=1033252 RepID=A0AAD7I8Q6_9AGAR|nr:hypothetical protein B0H16DRAFT_1891898 [Mycena metata]
MNSDECHVPFAFLALPSTSLRPLHIIRDGAQLENAYAAVDLPLFLRVPRSSFAWPVRKADERASGFGRRLLLFAFSILFVCPDSEVNTFLGSNDSFSFLFALLVPSSTPSLLENVEETCRRPTAADAVNVLTADLGTQVLGALNALRDVDVDVEMEAQPVPAVVSPPTRWSWAVFSAGDAGGRGRRTRAWYGCSAMYVLWPLCACRTRAMHRIEAEIERRSPCSSVQAYRRETPTLLFSTLTGPPTPHYRRNELRRRKETVVLAGAVAGALRVHRTNSLSFSPI